MKDNVFVIFAAVAGGVLAGWALRALTRWISRTVTL